MGDREMENGKMRFFLSLLISLCITWSILANQEGVSGASACNVLPASKIMAAGMNYMLGANV